MAWYRDRLDEGRESALEHWLGRNQLGRTRDLEDVERLDWELWLLSLLVIMLLLIAYVLNHSPQLLGTFDYVLKPIEMEAYVDGLAVLILLFCLYVIQKHRQLAAARRRVIAGQVEQEGLARRLALIECLLEFTSSADELLDVADSLERVLDTVREEMAADCAHLWSVDPDEDALVLSACAGTSRIEPGIRITFGEGLAGWVAERCEALLLNEPADLDLFPGLPAAEKVRGSALLVPMCIDGDIQGVLGVETHTSGSRFTHADQKLLMIFAASLAAARAKNILIEQLTHTLQRVRETQLQLVQTEKLAGLGEMLAGISHELNNPLSVVVGHTELLLREEGVKEKTRDRLEKMGEEAMRAKRLVENLLRIAKGEGSPREPADLNTVVTQSVGLLQYQLDLEGIVTEMNLEEDMPPAVLNPFRVQQLIFNVVNNARQALQEEQSDNRILSITTEYLEEGVGDRDGPKPAVHLEISDTGPGIPEEDLQHIFDPFFTTRDVDGGTGLGLSISYRTVKEHGGVIEAGNHPEGGAVFSIWLPVDLNAELPETPAERVRNGDKAVVEPGVVLIVDDEPRVREVLEEVLTLLGHAVISAGNGKEALEQVSGEEKPDAIVLDLKMPVMDGQEFFAELQDNYPGLAERVLFLTGDTLSPGARKFLEKSRRPYMSKPFTFNELKDHVEQMMGNSN
jgi:signal transduction histidine kinase/CheY-like chemotaxis protein